MSKPPTTIPTAAAPVVHHGAQAKALSQRAGATNLRAACWLCADVLLTLHELRKSKNAFRATDRRKAATGWKPFKVLLLDGSKGQKETQPLALSLYALPNSARRPKTGKCLTSDGNPFSLDEVHLAEVNLKTMLRQWLAPLEASTRIQVLGAVSQATGHHDTANCAELSENLLLLRDVLRPKLPELGVTATLRRGVHVDTLCRIDSCAFYIRGWAYSAKGPLRRLAVISPEGARVNLLERIFWHSRPDVNLVYGPFDDSFEELKCGFRCYFQIPAPNQLRAGWVLEAVDDDGREMEATMPEPAQEVTEVQKILVGDFTHERLPAQDLRSQHLLPALLRLDERRRKLLKLAWARQLGKEPENPRVSIVVPLYRRIDFMEYQLAQFARDPGMRNIELIYLLDSPELSNEVERRAVGLHELYRLPFKVAALQRNGGFAGVNNIGAELARGPLLLLLNSDVIPGESGWLDRMACFLETTPKAGIVGPKLLFEDDTLQHAGLYFRRSPLTGLWENHHYFKGLDRHLPAANVTRKVPAVTGACLLVERKTYLDLGGLKGVYLQGDYEDSDLCLRLRQIGRDVWYLPEVELYHLEGQSYSSQDRARNYALNQWLHSYLLGAKIEAAMRSQEEAAEH